MAWPTSVDGGDGLRTVAEMWASYAIGVVPKNAPAVQVQECRRAFYAGCAAMFYAAAYGIGDDSVEEDAGVNYLSAIENELKAYVADVLAERM